MSQHAYLLIIICIIVLFILMQNSRTVIARKIIQKRKSERNTEMIELAKRFIGKECLVYAFDSNHQFTGTIKEVSNGAILLQNGDSLEAINLDFVIRIREYPRNKKGKKKSVVID